MNGAVDRFDFRQPHGDETAEFFPWQRCSLRTGSVALVSPHEVEFILDELDEHRWDMLLAKSPDVLRELAAEAEREDQARLRRPNRRRMPAAPIRLFDKILKTWQLCESDAIPLLGLEPSDKDYIAEVLAGRRVLRGRDANDRIAYLIQIRMALFAWLRDEAEENSWLRESQSTLDGQVPMELLLEGSMENLLLVKEYVDAATGW